MQPSCAQIFAQKQTRGTLEAGSLLPVLHAIVFVCLVFPFLSIDIVRYLYVELCRKGATETRIINLEKCPMTLSVVIFVVLTYFDRFTKYLLVNFAVYCLIRIFTFVIYSVSDV